MKASVSRPCGEFSGPGGFFLGGENCHLPGSQLDVESLQIEGFSLLPVLKLPVGLAGGVTEFVVAMVKLWKEFEADPSFLQTAGPQAKSADGVFELT